MDGTSTNTSRIFDDYKYLENFPLLQARVIDFSLQFDLKYHVTELTEEPVDPWWRALLDMGLIFFEVYVFASIVMVAIDKASCC